MNLAELTRLVRNAGDAAYAVDSMGHVVAWNQAAEELFGIKADEAIERRCCDLLRGVDDAGVVCGPGCSVQRAIRRREPVSNYDIEVQTTSGRRWCNASVLEVDVGHSARPYSLHIIRSIDVSKRFERLLQEVVVRGTGVPTETARRGTTTSGSTAHTSRLSRREVEVLRMLAGGASTKEIALKLDLRPITVNNHVSHILRKLDAHTRLEAIRRAEQAGLI